MTAYDFTTRPIIKNIKREKVKIVGYTVSKVTTTTAGGDKRNRQA